MKKYFHMWVCVYVYMPTCGLAMDTSVRVRLLLLLDEMLRKVGHAGQWRRDVMGVVGGTALGERTYREDSLPEGGSADSLGPADPCRNLYTDSWTPRGPSIASSVRLSSPTNQSFFPLFFPPKPASPVGAAQTHARDPTHAVPHIYANPHISTVAMLYWAVTLARHCAA